MILYIYTHIDMWILFFNQDFSNDNIEFYVFSSVVLLFLFVFSNCFYFPGLGFFFFFNICGSSDICLLEFYYFRSISQSLRDWQKFVWAQHSGKTAKVRNLPPLFCVPGLTTEDHPPLCGINPKSTLPRWLSCFIKSQFSPSSLTGSSM